MQTEQSTEQTTTENATTEQTNEQSTEQQNATEQVTEKQEKTRENLLSQEENEQKIEHESLGKPENYDFSKLENDVSETVSTAFSDIAKELDLSQSAAEKILDKMSPVMQKHNRESADKMIADWTEQTKKDSEIGGSRLKENTTLAVKALDKFGNDSFRNLLNESGLGNHPEVIRFLSKIGKTTTVDTELVSGNKVGSGRDPNKPRDFQELANTMYPSYTN
jgi:predicted transcriptional regulator